MSQAVTAVLVVNDPDERPQVSGHGHFLGRFVGRFGKADHDFLNEDFGVRVVPDHRPDSTTVSNTLTQQELYVHQTAHVVRVSEGPTRQL